MLKIWLVKRADRWRSRELPAHGADGGEAGGIFEIAFRTTIAENGPKQETTRVVQSVGKADETAISAHLHQPLGLGRLTPPVNDRFAFQRSTRAFLRFFPGGFGACPHLLDTVEEQIAAVFLVKRHRIVVT
jgi:hypothetical protein